LAIDDDGERTAAPHHELQGAAGCSCYPSTRGLPVANQLRRGSRLRSGCA